MTPRRLDLRDVAQPPDRLLNAGYKRRDEHTTSTLRGVVDEKAISSDESYLKLLVQIQFEFAISEDVGYSYDQNARTRSAGSTLRFWIAK